MADNTYRYAGWLRLTSNGEEDDLLGLVEQTDEALLGKDPDILAELLQDDGIVGQRVTVRYYTAMDAVTWEGAATALIEQLMGKVEGNYGVYYSEITGYLWTDEIFSVGGHDVLDELKSAVGRYLLLEVTVHE